MSLLLHQGPCCTEDCHLRYDVKCRDDNGCRDAAYCDGTGPKCPDSNNKPNKTVCSGEFVCFMGVSQSHFFKSHKQKRKKEQSHWYRIAFSSSSTYFRSVRDRSASLTASSLASVSRDPTIHLPRLVSSAANYQETTSRACKFSSSSCLVSFAFFSFVFSLKKEKVLLDFSLLFAGQSSVERLSSLNEPFERNKDVKHHSHTDFAHTHTHTHKRPKKALEFPIT